MSFAIATFKLYVYPGPGAQKNLHPLSAYAMIQHSTRGMQSIATLRSALESVLNGW